MRSNKTFILLILFMICVGAANAQTGYKSAADKVKISGKTIVAKSKAYVNLMPMIIDEKQKRNCSRDGSLIAPVTIETNDKTNLPGGFEIKRIWLKSGDFWQSAVFNKDETVVKENSISSIARACPDSKFKVNEPVKIVVEIKHKGKTYFVASNQTKLERVY
jgi:hypothetical protein